MTNKIDEIKNRILCGDALEELKKFPNECVDMIITSPPYWGLRDYGVKGQIGLEPTLEEYLEKILGITKELKRVLKKSGVMFWNHGDAYCSSPPGNKFNDKHEVGDGLYGRLIDRNGMLDKNAKQIIFKKATDNERLYAGAEGRLKGGGISGVKQKCLMLQNWRLIIRMIDAQGWILRNTIVWHKPNHMPSSVKDRFANSYEPVFMLVKSKRYYFDLDAVREPITTFENRLMGIDREKDYPSAKRNKFSFNYRVRDAKKKSEQCPQFKASKKEIENYTKIPQDQAESFESPRAWKNKWHPEKYGKNDPQGARRGRIVPDGQVSANPAGKNPGDVWTIATQPFIEAHFATFPEKLLIKPIKAGCPPKGIVLDPFCGSGTSALVAQKLGRNYIGIEISEEYCKIAEKRLSQNYFKF